MKISEKFIIAVVVLLFTTVSANSATFQSFNKGTTTHKSSINTYYTPGSGVHPNTKDVYVAPLFPTGNRPSGGITPSANNGTRVAGRIRPYGYYRFPTVRSTGAVHLSDLNSNSSYNNYNRRYYNGYGNNVYINNNGNVYIRQ